MRVEGLARLLVLEQLATFDERQSFLRARRELRGRPGIPRRSRKTKRKYKNDLKSLGELEELEMNDYDVGSLHIPYGPGWDARRIDKLIYQTVRQSFLCHSCLLTLLLQDLGMNCMVSLSGTVLILTRIASYIQPKEQRKKITPPSGFLRHH